MLQEIEAIHATKPQLKQVVIEWFFWNSDKLRWVFEGVAYCFSIAELYSVVELAPQGDPFHDEADLTLLRALQVSSIEESLLYWAVLVDLIVRTACLCRLPCLIIGKMLLPTRLPLIIRYESRLRWLLAAKIRPWLSHEHCKFMIPARRALLEGWLREFEVSDDCIVWDFAYIDVEGLHMISVA